MYRWSSCSIFELRQQLGNYGERRILEGRIGNDIKLSHREGAIHHLEAQGHAELDLFVHRKHREIKRSSLKDCSIDSGCQKHTGAELGHRHRCAATSSAAAERRDIATEKTPAQPSSGTKPRKRNRKLRANNSAPSIKEPQTSVPVRRNAIQTRKKMQNGFPLTHSTSKSRALALDSFSADTNMPRD